MIAIIISNNHSWLQDRPELYCQNPLTQSWLAPAPCCALSLVCHNSTIEVIWGAIWLEGLLCRGVCTYNWTENSKCFMKVCGWRGHGLGQASEILPCGEPHSCVNSKGQEGNELTTKERFENLKIVLIWLMRNLSLFVPWVKLPNTHHSNGNLLFKAWNICNNFFL